MNDGARKGAGPADKGAGPADERKNDRSSERHPNQPSGEKAEHWREPSYQNVKELPGDPVPDPFEIDFLPEFQEGRGPRQPFVNESGVVIGDHDYASEHSPLEQWSKDTDPAVMAGAEWVHPYKDVGFHTPENKDYFEQGIPPQGGIFMHPVRSSSYNAEFENRKEDDGESGEREGSSD